ncbi:MAG: PEGA domain-containing protein, partial [Polyangiaceae bacterium]|nr:PEGA domain-containing protein [Polyangiaceae bacterium]
MGQSFDPDQNRKLPPVAPPPRKVGQSSPSGPSTPERNSEAENIPEMAVFRGLSGNSSPPSGNFRPLPAVTAPPPTRSKSLLPNVSPPPRRSSFPGEGLTDSVTKLNQPRGSVAGPAPIDTIRDAGPHSRGDAMDLAMTTEAKPRRAAAAEPLDWDDEEESTHVFDSSHPPPPMSAPTHPRMSQPGPSGPRLVRPSLPSQSKPPSQWGQNGSHPPQSYSVPGAMMNQAPTTDTMRLDTFEAQNGHARPTTLQGQGPMFPPASMPQQPERSGTLRQGTPALSGAFPPPPPVPSITQARPLIEPVRPLDQQDEVVRDQPYVRLPAGNPHTATELGLKRPSVQPPGMAQGGLPTGGLGISAPASHHERGGALSVVAQPYVTSPPDSRKWLLGAAGAAALLSIIALVAFFIMRRPGGIEVDVKDANGSSVPRAEVFVDGRKVCDATPCFVSDVEVGRHSVRVLTEGAAAAKDKEALVADVRAGEVARLVVSLEPSLGTLIVANDQAGVRIFVDGADRGTLPAKLTDLSPGKHEVKLSGERYKTWEKSVDVAAGESLDLGNPRLTVTKGRVLVTLKTEGARIELVRADDLSRPKALDGPFPRAVEVPIESGSWKLVAKKRGLPDFVRALDFSDGVAEKTIEVRLSKEDAEVAALTPAPTSPFDPGPARPDPTPRDPPPKADPPEPP